MTDTMQTDMAAPQAPKRRRLPRLSPRLCLIVLAGLIIAATSLHTVMFLASSREERLAAATRDTRNLALLLEEHAARSMQAADLMLRGVIDALALQPASMMVDRDGMIGLL